ncbi:maleylacetoacetate isomerase [Herminiimonas sp. CN]|uniref:maleylacetoacetate isomerase n=1 Tax=Herminiimonas sp. CN TaxID=1349818 RepID=UPI0004741AFA|nr:maleylacetoacetate isomerase [Herminiimonas sp. CN]
MKLYSYFRSSAAYRVRIALNLKGLAYDVIPVHLLRQGGAQFSPDYLRLNPEALVPVLIDDSQLGSGAPVLKQSLAIIEYLEEAYPAVALLPPAPLARAFVRGIALSIACDIHPLNNLRVLRYLARQLKVDQEDRDAWYRHWCGQGLAALEQSLAADARVGTYCYGDTPTLADCCLIPQLFNAERLDCDLSAMPTLLRIRDACMQLDAFVAAAPGNQPDAE